ncbi:rano class II histocompatibility antigen, B alpha chain-like isoform X2 [Sardina pilchardus]|uniref:rano class II histocompatibility antigen, B alpha chain-like isoform X2 n=1 Tax=Sardina pilchardus TaxID=27697 RepID=UPI002E119AAD
MKLAIFCLWVTCPLFHSGSQYLYQDAINDVYCDKGKKYFSVNVDDNQEFQDDMEPMARELGYPPEVKEPPVSAVYSREEVLLGSENTLICYVTRFYPPQITIRWMRNNENVTQGVSLSQIYANNDGSFNQISTLKFTPKKDDVYFCTVEHSALDEPLTREWDVEVSEPSLGPSVFCGVGLAVGLLGVATGTFLLVKGKDSRRHLGV